MGVTTEAKREAQLTTASAVVKALKAMRDPEKAAFYPRFFKAGPGEYGEGDRFFGVTVPKQRALANKCRAVPLKQLKKLLDHGVHEVRLTGLLIMVDRYQRALRAGDDSQAQAVVNLYLENLDRVNNWDLVDSSAHKILGPHLENQKDRSLLYDLAGSGHLWSQRVSIITTFHFIDRSDFKDALRLADVLLDHEHDLIHKAVGWVLREIGKKELPVMERFLKKRYRRMPRTMLRYAIEKLPQERRRAYLEGKI